MFTDFNLHACPISFPAKYDGEPYPTRDTRAELQKGGVASLFKISTMELCGQAVVFVSVFFTHKHSLHQKNQNLFSTFLIY